MSNYVAGHNAEKRAAEYLKAQGFRIIELNWKTRYCEIDIIAEKAKTIYFVEVKYRRSSKYGTGLDYILPRKLKQMHFAAEMWVNNRNWSGNYQMAALSLDGTVVTFVESII